MSTASRFDTFLKNIMVTNDQCASALTSANAIARKLHGHYSNQPYSDGCRMIVGSYGKGTAVNPPRDVDVLFFMPVNEYHRFNGYRYNGQSALLQELKGLFQERYPRTKEIGGDGQVVVVDFSTGHTVEVLPAWHRKGGGLLVPNTHDGGSWQHVDHAAEIAYVADAKELWYIRELYLHLLTDIQTDPQSVDIPRRRDELLEKLNHVYRLAPDTSSSAYRAAQRALQIDEDMTFSSAELDRFLPEALRTS